MARRALAQGFRPGTISSDLHVYNVDGPVYDLATTMSKFLHLGLSLDEVVHMTTAAPARVLRGAAALGTLAPGAAADVTLLERREGHFELEDTVGEKVTVSERLVPAGGSARRQWLIRMGMHRARCGSIQRGGRRALASPAPPRGGIGRVFQTPPTGPARNRTRG